jgi:hypothetical protein
MSLPCRIQLDEDEEIRPFEQPRDTRQQVQGHCDKFELWHKNSTRGESRLEL